MIYSIENGRMTRNEIAPRGTKHHELPLEQKKTHARKLKHMPRDAIWPKRGHVLMIDVVFQTYSTTSPKGRYDVPSYNKRQHVEKNLKHMPRYAIWSQKIEDLSPLVGFGPIT